MHNWQAILNNQTFTHADFNGMAYVDGLPNSLEALGDHVLRDGSLTSLSMGRSTLRRPLPPLP